MSTTAGDSDATVSELGWYGSWREKGHGKGKNGEIGKEKGKGKGPGKKRKEERKARASTTAGKETEAGGMSNVSRGGLNRFVVTVDTVGNGVTRVNGTMVRVPVWCVESPAQVQI